MTQMHSLREQPEEMRRKHFDDEEQITLTEAIGWAVLCIAFFGTMFAFLGA